MTQPNATRAGTPLVDLQGIGKKFGGVNALKDVSLSLWSGEVVGVVGHNGAGKSTLMKVLSGALTPDVGRILIRGEEQVIASPGRAHELGIEMIFQDLALLDNLSAVDNFFLGREVTRRVLGVALRDDARMKAIAREAIQRINANFENFEVEAGRLSGGQQQSISIARAIHMDTSILIMDEPTAALGPEETAMVYRQIRRLREHDIGIFLIGHDLNDVKEMSDRIVGMRRGQVVATVDAGTVSEDELLGMIISGRCPAGAVRGPGAVGLADEATG